MQKGIIDSICCGFPRVCGDVSADKSCRFPAHELSPRMRGCFRRAPITETALRAFPAYAGMFLTRKTRKGTRKSFPRVCGDVSSVIADDSTGIALSPRMRGCFRRSIVRLGGHRAFPAYAGMFPPCTLQRHSRLCFPRVCGDVSA